MGFIFTYTLDDIFHIFSSLFDQSYCFYWCLMKKSHNCMTRRNATLQLVVVVFPYNHLEAKVQNFFVEHQIDLIFFTDVGYVAEISNDRSKLFRRSANSQKLYLFLKDFV